MRRPKPGIGFCIASTIIFCGSWLIGVWYGDGMTWECGFAAGMVFVQWGEPLDYSTSAFIKPHAYVRGFEHCIYGVDDLIPDINYYLWPKVRHVSPYRLIRVPVWLPWLASCAWIIHRLVRRRRWSRLGCCLDCGYDLRGSIGTRCAECGAVIQTKPHND